MRDETEWTPVTPETPGDAGRAQARPDDSPGGHAIAEPQVVAHYHDTDCSEFLLRIYEYMDGEMGPEENLRFEAHVRECRPCLKQHQVDQTVKSLIRRVVPVAVAPEALRASVVARITTISFQTPD